MAKTDRRPTPSVTGNTSQTLLESSKGSPGGEGVLQTFFNSLLNRKSSGAGVGGGANTGGTGSPRPANTSVEALRGRDVHAELDRIIEGNSGKNPSNAASSE